MKKMLFIFLISFISLIGGRLAFTQTMDNYCAVPPFISAQGPPLVMLVMGRDHKLYYEAYNDTSDLDEDGELDVGYKHSIDYYGYFDPYKCYKYEGSGAAAKFVPTRTTPNKYCGGEDEWSGNFLNWLSMSRMDVLRKVLYGGYRSTDSSSETVLEGVYIPQDAHSWGKEYFGEDTRLLTPFDPPPGSCTIPTPPVSWDKTGEILFVIYDDDQSEVYGDDHDELLNSYSLCDYSSHSYITEMDTTDNYTNTNRIETGNYLLVAEFEVTSAGTWQFAIDSDDGSEVEIDGIVVANYYGGHWFCGCYDHSGSINLSPGWHRIIVRLRENQGDDGVIVWYKKPGDTAWTKFGSSTLNVRAPDIDDPCRLKTRDFIITGEPGSGGGTVECERHLFCVTSTSEGDPHKIRVLLNKSNRIWEWASKENPVCDNSLGTPDAEYYVRVKVCDPSVGLETNCKQYPNGNYKPIGLLQKFGEGDGTKVCSVSYKSCNTDSDCEDGEGVCVDKAKIYFGLLTGSYTKNLSGGVLRKNIWSISDEINPQTGMFKSSENVEGNIILTLDRLKTVGFEYSENYNEYTCGWITTRPLEEGECRMWGNPIAEMIYETLRYFAGKGSPTSEFTYSASNDSGLHLSKPDWGIRKGGNTLQPPDLFPWCSKPSIVIISDINPSYDSDTVPGSAFESYSGDLSDLNVADLAKTIGDEEGISNANYFIGQSNGVYDFICSSKEVSDLGKVRGLCPEEPTKQGSYYSAALAYYGHTKFKDNFTDPTKAENVTTYSVALSSPVPEIKIQVGEHTVTLVPVGKSVSGCGPGPYDVYTPCAQKCNLTYDSNKGLIISNCSSDAYCPSNQIVDFYVTEITPTHGKFRINFEDVEQGADHDMDSIVKYEYCVGDACNPALPANQVKITLSSDYAAGCIDQVLGFVISGTSEDGLYLPVKDSDTAPPPGDGDTPSVVASMPLTWEKTFTISSSSTAATLLKNPLWYAAKWGGFEDINNNNKPDLSNEWDKDGDGKPDTYFFVANPLKLEEKLSKVFADILKRASSGTAVSMLSTSTRGSGIFCQAYFLPAFTNEEANEELSWLGHLKGFWIDSLGQIREDSDENKELELDQDKVMKYFFDRDKTKIHLYNSDNTGKVTSPCFPAETKTLANVKTVWDAGKKLWERDLDDRTIYTSTDGSSFLSGDFTTTNASTLKDYLRAYNDTDAQNIIKYIRGEDVDICLDSDAGTCNETGHRSRELTLNGETHIWKLGDIVYSTPRILSHFPLNLYHIRYQDKTYSSSNESYPGFIEQKVYDPHQGTPSPTIKRDDYLFVGANDGMLHCFYLGKLRDKFCYDPGSNSYTNTCETDKDCDEGYLCQKKPDLEAKLEGDDIAKELWAYIPMNALPYLKYLAYPDYCHIYYVDQRTMLFDASINTDKSVQVTSENGVTKNWATILIGEMRFGGSPNPPSDAP